METSVIASVLQSLSDYQPAVFQHVLCGQVLSLPGNMSSGSRHALSSSVDL